MSPSLHRQSSTTIMGKKEKELPAVVYKYIPSSYASSVLEGGTMRIASRTGYNDPFEMQYQWESLNAATVLPHINRQLFAKFTGLSENADDQQISKQIERLLSQSNKTRLSQNSSNPSWDELYRLMEERTRICSFMNRNDSLTMWSYYAYNHQGICVGFKRHNLTKPICSPYSQKYCVKWKNVKYEDGIPRFHPIRVFMKDYNNSKPLNVDEFSETTMEKFYDTLITKGKMWTSEGEIRMILSVPLGPRGEHSVWSQLYKKEGEENYSKPTPDSQQSEYTDTMDVLNFPPEAVESIYFGCKADAPFIERIQSLCAEQYPNVTLFQMKQVENKYELTAYPLP
jgi:hypothetical protein|nr:MAG TPA: Protein of unknown function (DUF2971) [Bacteriophage sp.]